MTKTAATPIYHPVKTLETFSSPESMNDIHETCNVAYGTPAHHSWSNDDPGLTFAYCTARSNLKLKLFIRQS